jgi:hypothetical protein
VSLSLLFANLSGFAQCDFTLAKSTTNNYGFYPTSEKVVWINSAGFTVFKENLTQTDAADSYDTIKLSQKLNRLL